MAVASFSSTEAMVWVKVAGNKMFSGFLCFQTALTDRQYRSSHVPADDPFRSFPVHCQPTHPIILLSVFVAPRKHNSKKAVENAIARLMGNYIFLSEPYIPVQTRFAMNRALASDGASTISKI